MAMNQAYIERLTASGDYRVIRRLDPVERYLEDSGAESIGLYVR